MTEKGRILKGLFPHLGDGLHWFGRCIPLLIAWMCSLGVLAGIEPTQPRPDYVVLTHGIVGGFVPPFVRYKALFIRHHDDFEVFVMEHPRRSASQARYLHGWLAARQAVEVLDALEEIWTLPVEFPTGAEDIYRLDTGIAVRAGPRLWQNGGPGGCIHGLSEVRPSEEHRQRFQEMVQLVREAAAKSAKAESDAEAFEDALEEVLRALYTSE